MPETITTHYETYDIGLASFLDCYVGGVKCRKFDDRRCIFYIEQADLHKIDDLIHDYHEEKDATPAKRYRQKYKELSTMVGRIMSGY